MPYEFATCSDVPGMIGYTILDIESIVLCPRGLPPNKQPTLGNRNTDYTGVRRSHIGFMVKAISCTIFHELLHILFNRDSEFNILKCLFLFSTQIRLIFNAHLVATDNNEIYGYDQCFNLATTNAAVVVTHPDCVMLYAACKLGLFATVNTEYEIGPRKS